VIETGRGALVGIEVKASATVNAGDFKGLRKLAEACGDDFKLGVVLYDGGRPVPFGDRLVATPVLFVGGLAVCGRSGCRCCNTSLTYQEVMTVKIFKRYVACRGNPRPKSHSGLRIQLLQKSLRL
jgi:hypothetical protein